MGEVVCKALKMSMLTLKCLAIFYLITVPAVIPEMN